VYGEGCVEIILSKGAWNDHKKIHRTSGSWMYATQRGRGRSDVIPSFSWTGNLRPERIGPYRMVDKIKE